MTVAARKRAFPSPFLIDHSVLALVLWVALVIVVTVVAAGIALFGEVTGSVWNAASNLAPWYAALIGGYATYQMFPMFVANGRSRRTTFVESAIFLAAFSGLVAALVTAGFAIESALYRLLDWPLGQIDGGIYSTHSDTFLILLSWLATSIVWATTGAFLGAVFYRFGGNGWPSVIPAAILVAAVGLVAKPVVGPFGILMRPLANLVERLAPIEGAPTITLVLGTSILCTAIPLVITRMIVHDMPIRSRP